MNTQYLDNWGSSNPSTFLLLKKGTDLTAFNHKLRDFMRRKWKATYGDNDLKWIGILFAQRYSDRYLYNRYEAGAAVGGRIEYVRLFSIIAVFILLIACINFMNLATARSVKRAKEVGIRKTVGALRFRLIVQFIGEAILLTLIAFSITFLLVTAVLPWFNQLTQKQIIIPI